MQIPQSVDVVIVGGGVMGTSAAFHLAEAGVSVALFEAHELASGSTSKAAGGVRANFSDELNIALGARSLELLAEFGKRPGYEIDLHRPGYLFALTNPGDVELFERSTKLHHNYGVESRMISPHEARSISPLLHTEGLLACSFTPNDGHCTPEAVVLGYASGARKHGAHIFTQTKVIEIQTKGDDISAVLTDKGAISTGAVINCAGAWSLGALAEIRAPRLLDLGIRSGWTGLYEVTPDHNALLGEFAHVSRFFYATGFSGHGFLQGPAIGEILRDLYLEREPFIDISALSAERFTESGELRPEMNIV
ncbi:MAG: FAD-binding oxidoreductase [Actinobacteria bacterium]|nr:FAD-binding oxidoreductase [Actinomycetota bacterium]